MNFTKLQSATVYTDEQQYELADFLNDNGVLALREKDSIAITCQTGNILCLLVFWISISIFTLDLRFNYHQESVSVSTWDCKSSGKILDGYEVEFTGENINCVATTTTTSTGKPAEVTPNLRKGGGAAWSPKVWTYSPEFCRAN